MMKFNALINLKPSDKTKQDKKSLVRYSTKLLEALDIAVRIAAMEKRRTLMPRHLMSAMLLTKDSAAYLALTQMGISTDDVITLATKKSNYDLSLVKDEDLKDIKFNKEVIQIFEEAFKVVLTFGSYYIGTEHILLAMVKMSQVKDWPFIKPITDKVKNMQAFFLEVIRLSNAPFDILNGKKPIESVQMTPNAIAPTLEANKSVIAPISKYTLNLTDLIAKAKAQGFKRKFYVRDKYIKEIIYSMLKPENFNILLVGPSGVGKTHLVFDLAEYLTRGDAPFLLKYKSILQLYLPAIFKDSKLPGDTEKQILNILNILSQAREYILYIEDFGTIINPLVKGGMSMASVFKTSLEFRNVPIIASMTRKEYEQAKDSMASIFRNFSVIEIDEPDTKELRKILKAYTKHLTKTYGVHFDDDVVDYTIKLVNSYIQDKVNPQKNIDIINFAVAKLIEQYTQRFEIVSDVEKTLNSIEEERAYFILSGDFSGADALRKKESSLYKELEALKNEISGNTKPNLGTITTDVILNVVAKITDLPVQTLASGEASMLLKLEDKLKEKIVSQEEAITKVAYAVKRGRVGITSKSRPWASFLFLGPTGVGKTELAKVLARTLFGDDTKRLIQIDMSEYMEPHSVSKLIGSPPGYIGYERGGMLTRLIRENPYSVVLFDEIEKAHYDVLNLLLQILEEGRLRDSHGNIAYFNNAIIILTSNIGAKKIFEDKILGFYRDEVQSQDVITAYDSIEEDLKRELKKKIRPELLNRLDDVIIFRTLTKRDASKILEILLKELNERLREKGIEVLVGNKVKEFLLDKGFSAEYGARQLRRTVQTYIENSLADYILRYRVSFDPKNLKRIELSVSPDKRRLILKKKR